MAAEIGDRIVRGAAEDLDIAEEQRRQLRKALSINDRLLDGLRKSVAPGEGDARAPTLLFGEGASPDLTLRRCFLNLQTRLKDDGDGAAGDGGGADSAADEAAVRAMLAEAERDEPIRR
jgi:hypothetical protein